MALLHESVNYKKLDVRLVERNVARGVLTQDELDKALAKLPDDSENAEWVSVESLTQDPDEVELNGQAPLHQH